MNHVAKFIVKYRIAIAAIFVVIAAVCAIATMQVKINKDMTQYLPSDMQVKIGMDVMAEEFGESSQLRLMTKGVSHEDCKQLADDLAAFELVSSVSYEADSPDYNQDDYSLLSITVEGNSFSEEAQRAFEAVEKACESRGYEYWVAADLGNSANDLGPVYVAAVFLAMIILFTLASSWIEPVLLLITIVIAVLINMGTNIFLPSISDTTFSIAAVLQMALSMDYLIMLMNRYRAERENHGPEVAMENALTQGVTAIASSSATTVVGLLCLVFMSFTIGADMGIVLAKGVFLSLVCVFGVQPAIAIAADRLLFSTAKPYPQPQMRFLSKVSYALRVPMVVLFIVLFAIGYSMRDVTQIDFVASNANAETAIVNEVFPAKQQVVVLYENDKTADAVKLADKVADDRDVSSVSSYENTVGKRYTTAEMADQMGMGEPLVGMLYYYKFNDGNVGLLSKGELVSYLRGGIAEDLGGMLDDTTLSSISSLADMVEAGLEEGAWTPEQMAAQIGKHSVDANTLKLMFLAYRGSHDTERSWTLSLDELTAFLVDNVMNDAAFDSFFDNKTRDALKGAREQVESGASQLKGEHYSRFIVLVPYESNANEMDAFCTRLSNEAQELLGDSGWYLVGEGPMVQEMTASFGDEFGFISLLTIGAILLIVLITFRSLAIPLILVALIQSAFCWDMMLSYALGNSIYYLALIVVQSILMGATIDYAILYTTNYRESRESMSVREAVGDAYRRSIRTISMSGGILVVVTGVLGVATGGLTGKICLIISEGSAIAVVLVLLVLPGVIAALDRLVVPRKRRFENRSQPTGEVGVEDAGTPASAAAAPTGEVVAQPTSAESQPMSAVASLTSADAWATSAQPTSADVRSAQGTD